MSVDYEREPTSLASPPNQKDNVSCGPMFMQKSHVILPPNPVNLRSIFGYLKVLSVLVPDCDLADRISGIFLRRPFNLQIEEGMELLIQFLLFAQEEKQLGRVS